MKPVDVISGASPIVLGLPHTGTYLPPEIAAQLNPRGRELADTDWHVDRLYEGLLPGASVVRANFHRYVIDANRDPGGNSLYPGQNTTGLVPTTDFDGAPIWMEEPRTEDVSARLRNWHTPYHEALSAELERTRAQHGVAILFDCHSIRSDIPFLFEGRLPDLNLGTAGGESCAPELQREATAHLSAAPGYDFVANARFKGGWCTRHYGRPESGIHAVQLELAQSTYLESEAPPWRYDTGKAARLRPILKDLLAALSRLALTLKG